MPMPIGGSFALHHTSVATARPLDPNLELYREQQRYIQSNLRCSLQFFRSIIPANGGKLEGILVMEAKSEVDHTGIFVVMKGLTLPHARKRHMEVTHLPSSSVKFTVLASTYTGNKGDHEEEEEEYMAIDAHSRETHPLEFTMPEEMPPPIITAEGKLAYKMKVFVSTLEGRHVWVGEESVRWQGHRVLTQEEIETPVRLEQEVTKKGFLGLVGKKKSVQGEWVVERGGYLPGESIRVELLGETKDKGGVELECGAELMQKVWYQVPSLSRKGHFWTKMKVKCLGKCVAGREDTVLVGAGDGGKKTVWQGQILVPKGLTPSIKFDCMSSISYFVRVTFGVAGEGKDGCVTGEIPVLIGTSKELTQTDGVSDEEDNDEDDDELSDLDSGYPQTPSPVPMEMQRARSCHNPNSKLTNRSNSMTFSNIRIVVHSADPVRMMSRQAASAVSVFRQPPSYSQLFSGSPTTETLPPPYSELDFQSQASQQSVSSASVTLSVPDNVEET